MALLEIHLTKKKPSSKAGLTRHQSETMSTIGKPECPLLLSQTAPVPPDTLLGGKERVSCLRYSRAVNIEDADVLPLPRPAAEFSIKIFGVTLGQFSNGMHLQQGQLTPDRRPDRGEVFQLPFLLPATDFTNYTNSIFVPSWFILFSATCPVDKHHTTMIQYL